ncbi:MAG TPA: hypothetical protein DIW43_10090 [Spongiibacteraceae bacterium]|nr:hypothetical protein [Spongiibacteraceae bacterium]HCS27795.1 hypothetical protein [Spongiibacteraceae bacterium]|tara:strand:+ start:1453 stop:2286 length:834 start_codon:yes stop_codon:yes gene_type:complete
MDSIDVKRKSPSCGESSDFIASLSAEAIASAAVNHPYLQAFRDGDFPNVEVAIRDFAFQYGCYSNAFTGYVSAVISKLEQKDHRDILRANLAEEQGNAHDADLPPAVLAAVAGQPHRLLYRHFQEALGIDEAYRQRQRPIPLSRNWQQQFARLCETNACVGVGALGIGTELIVSRIYQQILAGLKQHSNLSITQRVFFDLHSFCDDQHAADLLMITENLARDDEARQQIAYGARAAIAMRVTFWDAMLERAVQIARPDWTDVQSTSMENDLLENTVI